MCDAGTGVHFAVSMLHKEVQICGDSDLRYPFSGNIPKKTSIRISVSCFSSITLVYAAHWGRHYFETIYIPGTLCASRR